MRLLILPSSSLIGSVFDMVGAPSSEMHIEGRSWVGRVCKSTRKSRVLRSNSLVVHDSAVFPTPTTHSPAPLQANTRDATRPAPISRTRVHSPPIDIGIQTSGLAQIPSEGPAYQDL